MSPTLVDPVRTDRVLRDFSRAVDDVVSTAGAIDHDDMHRPTPCTDWDVAALSNHIVFVLTMYGRMAAGREDRPDPEANLLSPRFQTALQDAADRTRREFERPGMLEQEYDSPWGKVPGAVLVQHVTNEMVIHGWDLARAVGRTPDTPDDLARSCRDVVATWIEQFPDIRTRQYSDEQPASDDAGEMDRLAAFTGRTLR